APAQLKRLVASGQIRPEDMLLREGQRQWVQAGTVRGLFPEPASAEAAPGPRPTNGPTPARPKPARAPPPPDRAGAGLRPLACAGGGLFLALLLGALKPTGTPSAQAKLDGDKQNPGSNRTAAAAPTTAQGTAVGTTSPRTGSGKEEIQEKLLGRWEATRGEI